MMDDALARDIRQLLNLYKLVNGDVIEQKKQTELSQEVRRSVYDACELPATARDVGAKLKMSPQAVRYHLNYLLQRGLLESWVEEGKAVFVKAI